MFLDAISLIAKILAVIVVTIAGVTLLYLLVDFIFNCLAERQDVEASIIGIEKEKDFYREMCLRCVVPLAFQSIKRKGENK